MVEIPEKVLTPAEDELIPQTPKGTEGETTPKKENTPIGGGQQPIEDEDYKQYLEVKKTTGFKRFSDSAREAQRLLEEDKLNKARLAELDAKLAEKANAIPSEDDLSIKYPDWDMFTEAEKAIYRKVETQERELQAIKEEKAWERDFSKVKTKFSELSEKEPEFREYCNKYPRTVEVETLAKSFLYDEGEPEKPKRKGLETPTAGPKEGITNEMTWEDVERIRQGDPKLFAKMVTEGRIDTRKIKK